MNKMIFRGLNPGLPNM